MTRRAIFACPCWKADAVLVSGARPLWLEQLLNSARGRGVLFSLAERHPNCLLITAAIQHAWQHGQSKAGHRQKSPATSRYPTRCEPSLIDINGTL